MWDAGRYRESTGDARTRWNSVLLLLQTLCREVLCRSRSVPFVDAEKFCQTSAARASSGAFCCRSEARGSCFSDSNSGEILLSHGSRSGLDEAWLVSQMRNGAGTRVSWRGED